MERIERIQFWVERSADDFDRSKRMLVNKDYSYALFFGQMGLEKLFKALYIKVKNGAPPAVHNLVYLAGKCDLDIDKHLEEDLREISKFNIDARYDDYKLEFYLKAKDLKFTDTYLNKILEVKKWLETQLK